jgi:5-hydroxyisourate hydrolase
VQRAGRRGSAEYEARFGHVFLICAATQRREMLAELRPAGHGAPRSSRWSSARRARSPGSGWPGRSGSGSGVPQGGGARRRGGWQRGHFDARAGRDGHSAAGLGLALSRRDDDGWRFSTTGRPGRTGGSPGWPWTSPATTGSIFDTGRYQPDGFYPEVVVVFRVTDPAGHYHVPLLLSPFSYATYRGS